jgi:hypothetical protein
MTPGWAEKMLSFLLVSSSSYFYFFFFSFLFFSFLAFLVFFLDEQTAVVLAEMRSWGLEEIIRIG